MTTLVVVALAIAVHSGINLYATVAVLGLCARFNLVTLPDRVRAFEHPLAAIIAFASVLIRAV